MKLIVLKKYLKLYEKTAVNRLLGVLFKFPDKEFSLSDLAREAGVAKANIGRILERLYRVDFIEITKLAKIWRIKANQQNPYFIRKKIVHNLDFVYRSGLVEFLKDYFDNPKSIILFGSFRKGEDISSSDIDIAIETDEANSSGLKLKELKKSKEMNEIERMINRKIQIHLFNRKHIDINVFNNIANGIVLFGFLEVKP